MALNRVGEHGIRLSISISLDQASDGLAKELDVVKRVVSLDLLVQVGVECDLLHIFGVAELNKGLASTKSASEGKLCLFAAE